jgi:hypothetical protein
MALPQTELSDPPKDWLGFANTRVWKWGNTGCVASVVIEKPHRGDFTALVDGGFDLQYAPLLLQRLGGGEVVWCQMDVSGRTAPDPAADRLLVNLVNDCARTAGATTASTVRYVGGDDGAAVLRSLGVPFQAAEASALPDRGVLVVGPGAGGRLASARAALDQAVRRGLVVVALKQTPDSLQGWLPFEPIAKQEARTQWPMPPGRWFAGLGPSDLHWRGWRETTLVGGPGVEPNVVSAVPHGEGAFVFCQVLPTDWDYADPYRVYLKRTHNRTAAMLSRLLANCGARSDVPTLNYLGRLVDPTDKATPRWIRSYYLDAPEQLDDPYRYNRW